MARLALNPKPQTLNLKPLTLNLNFDPADRATNFGAQSLQLAGLLFT